MPVANRHAKAPIEAPTFSNVVSSFSDGFISMLPMFDIKTGMTTGHNKATFPNAPKALYYTRNILGLLYGYFLSLRPIPLQTAGMLATLVLVNLPQMYFSRALGITFEDTKEWGEGAGSLKGILGGFGCFILVWIWGFTVR